MAGHDVAADPDGVRAAIGVTGQFSAVDDLLTGEENLRLMADLHHLGREAGRGACHELLERVRADRRPRRKPVSTYSGGMRRRLDLAMTLVGAPQRDLPRRADHGTRSRAAAARCGTAIRDAGRRRRHDLPDHPVPGRGGRARRPDRGARPRPDRRRGQRRRAEATDSRRSRQPRVHRPPGARAAAERSRRRGARRGASSRSRCPTTAASRRCGALLDRARRRRGARSSGSRSTRPTSTTSSSPSPATPPPRSPQPMTTLAYTVTDSTTCCAAISAACSATRR